MKKNIAAKEGRGRKYCALPYSMLHTWIGTKLNKEEYFFFSFRKKKIERKECFGHSSVEG